MKKRLNVLTEKIKSELSTQKVHSVRCSISIGYSTKAEAGGDGVEILRNAEVKMYNIKSIERNNTQNLELRMMMDALFAKSDWEKRHAARVRDMCGRLGKAMNLTKSDVSKLKQAAYFHDIGKAVVGSDVLQNDGTFNTVEISDVELHPAVGYRILSYFDSTVELAGIVLAHHERWDGSGYPKGLSREDIPLEARIMTVVEAYDRMMNTLDNSRAKSHEEALEEIQRCAGTQFDPYVAEIFAGMFSENK
ncbi:MAG: HD domain-containing phosphohydrolase [Muricomes sp.]